MTSFIKICALFFFLNAFTCAAPQNAKAQVSVDFKVFYDELSPYGSWVNTAEYGYAWIPDVAGDFEPYNTNGYWIFTDDGWTWVSDYAWGWAPFHYGRWYDDAEYGPMWIPGNEWGPGWVTWRQSEGYYGWAPIGPGISIDIAYGNSYNLPYNQWTFVRDRDFGRSNINKYYIDRSNNVTIINNTTVINNVRSDRRNNTRYNGGPDRNEVQRRSGNAITPVVVRESNKPGQHLNKTGMEVYRPRIEQNNNAGQIPAPAKVKDIKDVQQRRNRNIGNDEEKKNDKPQQQNTPPQKQQPQQPAGQQPQQQRPQQPERQPQPKQPERQQPQQPQKQQPQQPERQQPQPNKQPERQQPKQPQRQPQQPQRQQPQQPQRQQQPKQPERQQPQKQQPQQPQRQPQPKQPERQQPQRQQPQQPQRQPQPKQPERQQPTKDKHDNNPKKELAVVVKVTGSSIEKSNYHSLQNV